MTRYRVSHCTTYDYDDLVIGSHHSAHLVPRQLPYQQVENTQFTFNPAPAHHTNHEDHHGNRVDAFQIQFPHQHLQVCVVSTVTVLPRPSPIIGDFILSDSWEPWAEQCRKASEQDLSLHDVLSATPLTPQHAEIATWARSIFFPGRPLWDAVTALTHAIFSEFQYAPGTTDIDTPLADAFARRQGVCQDFAHVMIAALRSCGIPARYVSGYLETQPPPGQERLVGADASHAWVSVYLPHYGWVDCDPTNNCVVGDHHITLAWGRDYNDVPPLKGIIQGGGEHQVQVAVDVSRE